MGTFVLNTNSPAALFAVLGYLSGSVLYARVFARLFGNRDILSQSRDQNPGTANAFMYGGFMCGLCTLVFDLLKGFLPVYLFVKSGGMDCGAPAAAMVIAAPVLGHAFPLFHGFRGGKGIAVSFGCLAGLYPELDVLLTLAFFFIVFSTAVKITPNLHRTAFAYIFALVSVIARVGSSPAVLGFAVITAIVLLKLFTSGEKRDRLEVKLFGFSDTFVRDRRRT